MTQSRVGAKLHLSRDQVKTQAPAYSEVAQHTAARMRWVWEMAHGASAVSGEPAIADTNPQGEVGWDWSGAPFGNDLLLPIVTSSLWSPAANSRVRQEIEDLDSTLTAPRIVRMRIWQRPFASLPSPHIAPRSRAYLLAQAIATGGSCNVTFGLRNTSMGGAAQTASVSIGTTTTAVTPTGIYLPMRPGWNQVDVTILPTTASRTVKMISLCLYNRFRRPPNISYPG